MPEGCLVWAGLSGEDLVDVIEDVMWCLCVCEFGRDHKGGLRMD